MTKSKGVKALAKELDARFGPKSGLPDSDTRAANELKAKKSLAKLPGGAARAAVVGSRKNALSPGAPARPTSAPDRDAVVDATLDNLVKVAAITNDTVSVLSKELRRLADDRPVQIAYSARADSTDAAVGGHVAKYILGASSDLTRDTQKKFPPVTDNAKIRISGQRRSLTYLADELVELRIVYDLLRERLGDVLPADLSHRMPRDTAVSDETPEVACASPLSPTEETLAQMRRTAQELREDLHYVLDNLTT